MTSRISEPARTVALISADAEWRAVRGLYPAARLQSSPYGEWFPLEMEVGGAPTDVIFLQGGWGKIAAAASTQYAIDRWRPELLVNLGTCGGFAGEIAQGEIILVERTAVYDILEQMGDADEHLRHYTTHIDLSWLGEELPQPVVRATLVSGDRDLLPAQIAELKSRYGAKAGDWETAAIAWVAGRNKVRCLVLRGVSDLVDEMGSPAYTDGAYFERAARDVMQELVGRLPAWISLALKGQ